MALPLAGVGGIAASPALSFLTNIPSNFRSILQSFSGMGTGVSGAASNVLNNTDQALLQKIYDVTLASKINLEKIIKNTDGLKNLNTADLNKYNPTIVDNSTQQAGAIKGATIPFSADTTFLTLLYDAELKTNDQLDNLTDLTQDILDQLKSLNLSENEMKDLNKKNSKKVSKEEKKPEQKKEPTPSVIWHEIKGLLGLLLAAPLAAKGANTIINALKGGGPGAAAAASVSPEVGHIHSEEAKGSVITPKGDLVPSPDGVHTAKGDLIPTPPPIGTPARKEWDKEEAAASAEMAGDRSVRDRMIVGGMAGAPAGSIFPKEDGSKLPPPEIKGSEAIKIVAREIILKDDGSGEGFSPKIYKDIGSGHKDIGYGHDLTIRGETKGFVTIEPGHEVSTDNLSKKDAGTLLGSDLREIERKTQGLFDPTIWSKMTNGQKAAMIDVVYRGVSPELIKDKVEEISNILFALKTPMDDKIKKEIADIIAEHHSYKGKKGLEARAAADSKVAMMAEGGLVNKPTLAIIGEKGPEVVMPLEDARSASLIPAGLEGKAAKLMVDSANAAMSSSKPPTIIVPPSSGGDRGHPYTSPPGVVGGGGGAAVSSMPPYSHGRISGSA